jgi:hypothetical protein
MCRFEKMALSAAPVMLTHQVQKFMLAHNENRW